MGKTIPLEIQAEDSSSEMKVYPLLSPQMESELLKKSWPQLETNTLNNSTHPFWEENFQDLSDWCVDPREINRFHTPHPSRENHNYRIGEDIKSNNSGVKDNYDNLSNNKSASKEIRGIEENLTVDKNSKSTGGNMSFYGSVPFGQEQSNNTIDISDVWLVDPISPTNNGINNEGQIMDNTEIITQNKNENLPDHSLNLIGETIDNWFPIITTTDNDISNDIVNYIQCDDNNLLDNYQSTPANNLNDIKSEQKQLLKDILLTNDVGSGSFDLLSYVCDEDGNLLDKKINNENKELLTTPDIVENFKVENTNNRGNKTRKSKREKKISEVRAKVEPYVPPIRINLKSKNVLENKTRTSKRDEDYTDEESDSHTSTDYNYRELREKNNMASRKSRINKKVKESEMLKRASDLERDNAVLKMKVEELEKLVTSMRAALLQSALKRERN